MGRVIPRAFKDNIVPALIPAALVFFIATNFAVAQPITIDRQYEHALVAAQNLAQFSGGQAPVSELFLYAFRNGVWEQIPFQIDERDAGGSYFDPDDGQLDDNDQLVFMISDVGARAPINDWLDNASARSFPRYEIELVDAITNERGYAYLYRSQTITTDPQLPFYMAYSPGPAGMIAADTVRGTSYAQAHLASNGIPNYIAVKSSFGGTNTDVLDRLKLRLNAQVAIFSIGVNEENLSVVENGIRVVVGRVRVIRELTEDISVSGFSLDPVAFNTFFYPFSQQLSGVIVIPDGISTKLIRVSYDFNGNAFGYQWHNQNAGPRNITGSSGTLSSSDDDLTFLPNRNWFAMIGQHGSFLGIFGIDPIPDTDQKFYFYDNPNGTNDGTDDTGDTDSVGDTGFMATSGNSIDAAFNLGFSTFMLAPDLTRAEAIAINANAEQPVGQLFDLQEFDLVAPVAVNDLRVATSTVTSVTVEWSAPSDAGSGVASYELGFSTTAVGNDPENWFANIADKATNLPTPGPPGSTESATVPNLTTGARYFFMLRSIDGFGNASALSNIATIDAVPVELIAFNAEVERNLTTLVWSTASETNNLGFYVERQAGDNGEWTEVAFIRGHGTTTQEQEYAFQDARLQPGRYHYRLRQVDFDGSFEYSPQIEVAVATPERFVLKQNYPNPLSLAAPGNTVIQFELANREPVEVELRLYNLLGREVKQLLRDTRAAGYYEIQWDGRLESGVRAPAGIYFYELRAGNTRALKKLTIM